MTRPVTIDPICITGHVCKSGAFKLTVTRGAMKIEGTMTAEDALTIGKAFPRHVRRNAAGEIEFSFEGFAE